MLFPVQSLVCPAAPSQASSQAGRLCPFRRRGAGGSEPRPGPWGVAERANPRSSPLGGPPLPWSRRGWLGGTASCVLTSLAPCALESQHDGGSGLVSGPAAAHAGEGGGDPLSQQVPPAAPASGEARQVRGGATRASVRPACGWAGRGGGGRGAAGLGVGCAGAAFGTEQMLLAEWMNERRSRSYPGKPILCWAARTLPAVGRPCHPLGPGAASLPQMPAQELALRRPTPVPQAFVDLTQRWRGSHVVPTLQVGRRGSDVGGGAQT